MLFHDIVIAFVISDLRRLLQIQMPLRDSPGTARRLLKEGRPIWMTGGATSVKHKQDSNEALNRVVVSSQTGQHQSQIRSGRNLCASKEP